MEVPDDYVVLDSNWGSESIRVETAGEIHLSFECEEDYGFITLDENFNNLSSLRKFLFWSNMAWLGFYYEPDFPEKLKLWLTWFNKMQKIPSEWIRDLLRRRLERSQELITHQINFAKWDIDVFVDPNILWHSLS